ncbi:hypothetical protein [Priestia megaterium]|uniref:hypothetical protein n=1 Tax=Priestia megaterium TaxID=1404 RepID=UPI001868051B|nr:hypothetical protein [Priestia megaterium]MBE2973416.1 hypothetical protein [Priestia megaterium]
MTTKSDNFKRLAEKRVTDCIKKLRLIGNLANKNNYDYTEEEVKLIISTLESEIKSLKNRFKEESESNDYIFSFNDKK